MSEPTQPARKGQDFEQVLDGSAKEVASFEVKHSTMLKRIQHVLHNNPTLVPVIVLILSLIGNILNLTDFVSPYLNGAIQGIIIILAVILQRERKTAL